jgi:hypothetical protein
VETGQCLTTATTSTAIPTSYATVIGATDTAAVICASTSAALMILLALLLALPIILFALLDILSLYETGE